MKLYSPPELAQGLAELRVMEAGILVTQPPPRCLGPHHKRVHWPLHMDPLLIQPEHNQCNVVFIMSGVYMNISTEY